MRFRDFTTRHFALSRYRESEVSMATWPNVPIWTGIGLRDIEIWGCVCVCANSRRFEILGFDILMLRRFYVSMV